MRINVTLEPPINNSKQIVIIYHVFHSVIINNEGKDASGLQPQSESVHTYILYSSDRSIRQPVQHGIDSELNIVHNHLDQTAC